MNEMDILHAKINALAEVFCDPKSERYKEWQDLCLEKLKKLKEHETGGFE